MKTTQLEDFTVTVQAFVYLLPKHYAYDSKDGPATHAMRTAVSVIKDISRSLF